MRIALASSRAQPTEFDILRGAVEKHNLLTGFKQMIGNVEGDLNLLIRSQIAQESEGLRTFFHTSVDLRNVQNVVVVSDSTLYHGEKSRQGCYGFERFLQEASPVGNSPFSVTAGQSLRTLPAKVVGLPRLLEGILTRAQSRS
jgi:hypothetical protein